MLSKQLRYSVREKTSSSSRHKSENILGISKADDFWTEQTRIVSSHTGQTPVVHIYSTSPRIHLVSCCCSQTSRATSSLHVFFYNGTTFKLELLRLCLPLFTWPASQASLPSATERPSDLCFSSANCKESRPRSRKMGSTLARDCWRGYKRWITLHYITKCLIPPTFGKRVHLNQFGADPAPAWFSSFYRCISIKNFVKLFIFSSYSIQIVKFIYYYTIILPKRLRPMGVHGSKVLLPDETEFYI